MVDTPTKPKRPLTPKQEQFILEYAKDFNATQAAIRAGYSPKQANSSAARLVRKCTHVIEQRKATVLAQRKSTGIATLEQTLKLVTAMAFYDPGKMYDDHGNCKEIQTLSRVNRLAVAGFKVSEEFTGRGDERECTGYLKEFKLTDRAVWAHMLMKHHGAFPSKVEQPSLPASPPGGIDWSSLSPEERTALRQQIASAVAAAVVAQRAESPRNGHANGHGA